jgi:hypothetical protein
MMSREDADPPREDILVLQTLFLSLASALNRSDPPLSGVVSDTFEHAELLLTARVIDQPCPNRSASALGGLRILETMREAIIPYRSGPILDRRVPGARG